MKQPTNKQTPWTFTLISCTPKPRLQTAEVQRWYKGLRHPQQPGPLTNGIRHGARPAHHGRSHLQDGVPRIPCVASVIQFHPLYLVSATAETPSSPSPPPPPTSPPPPPSPPPPSRRNLPPGCPTSTPPTILLRHVNTIASSTPLF